MRHISKWYAVFYICFHKCSACKENLKKIGEQKALLTKESLKAWRPKNRMCGYLIALTVYVAPQLFNTSADVKPASMRASISCFTVSGVS